MIPTDPIIIAAIVVGALSIGIAVYGGADWVSARVLSERGVYDRIIARKLRRLFLEITPQAFLGYHALAIVAAIALVSYLAGDALLGFAIGAIVGGYAPKLWLDLQWTRRLTRIDEQVEEAMVYMANSFKANPSLIEAFQDVISNMGPPIGQEIGILVREYKLGTPIDQALINLQRRVPSRNLRMAISALLIGRIVGGNIPDILEEIAGTIRESYRLERMIDARTAQGKMQAYVMGAAPSVVCALFYWLKPDLIQPLFTTLTGAIVIAIALSLNVVGFFFVMRVVRIRV